MKTLVCTFIFVWSLALSAACIVYPAKGNISWDEGTLEMLVAADFDPSTPPVKNMEMHGTVFQMDFPGDPYKNHFVLKFWKRKLPTGKIANELRVSLWFDGKGQGGPAIPVNNWKKGEFHHIAMAWNKGSCTMYSDGKAVWKGRLNFPRTLDTAKVYLLAGSRALWWQKSTKPARENFLPEEKNMVCIAAMKISADCRLPGSFTADKLTLLLEDYRKNPPEKGVTKPIIISDSGKQNGMIYGSVLSDSNGIYLYGKKGTAK
ncbi:MAG: hypothetical protein J6S53_01985 [Lentisphaeria bacterium]|nr:hypothetical protein [Lentisphaeria bacterium]